MYHIPLLESPRAPQQVHELEQETKMVFDFEFRSNDKKQEHICVGTMDNMKIVALASTKQQAKQNVFQSSELCGTRESENVTKLKSC